MNFPFPIGKSLRESRNSTLISKSIHNHCPKLLNSNGLIGITLECINGYQHLQWKQLATGQWARKMY